MQQISPGARLRVLVDDYEPLLAALTESSAAQALAPGKWSAKELLGHLIDSASNNHGRFLRAQDGRELVFPGYDQDAWVARQRYTEAPWAELITLWCAFNRHLARVMDAISEGELHRPRATHNLHEIAWRAVPETEPATLAFFLEDYVDHCHHHLQELP